jgi:putative membrane protein
VPTDEPPERPDSRLRLGLETTLLAWIRTGLAMTGFGFVLARFGLFLQELMGAGHVPMGHIGARQVHASLWFGIALIVVGVGINVAAAVMYYPFLVRTRSGEDDLPATWKLALALAALMAVAGIAMTVLLFVMEAQT